MKASTRFCNRHMDLMYLYKAIWHFQNLHRTSGVELTVSRVLAAFDCPQQTATARRASAWFASACMSTIRWNLLPKKKAIHVSA